MSVRLFAYLLLCLCYTPVCKGNKYVFEYTGNCSRAYQSYMSLHMEEAHGAIVNEMRSNPNNLMSAYVADYEDCLILLLNCDKYEYEVRKDHFDTRLDLMDRGDENSPWYRLCKAGIYLHWALVNTRFGEQYKAALKFRKSFALLKENQRLFPGFEYNQVFSGLQEAVVGSLPGNYKWLAAVFGLKGNLKKGTAKLAAFIDTHNSQQALYSETVLYYAYTRFYLLSEQKEVWNFLSSSGFSTQNNLLNTFVKANIALDFRKSDAAIGVLKAASSDADYIHYPIFNYQMGLAMLTKSGVACVDYFQSYLGSTKSNIYIKECWQKMAWAWYLDGNMQQAEYCRHQAAAQGTTILDVDKQAEKFAESKVWPSKKLLQARLLIDGGYYNQAFSLLSVMDHNTITNPGEKAEYFYRLAKVYEELTDTKRALEYYQYAINAGKDRHEQFAARAALQMGLIYEHTGVPDKAINRYKLALDMPAHDFQNSIDQQAKAGISRMERN